MSILRQVMMKRKNIKSKTAKDSGKKLGATAHALQEPAAAYARNTEMPTFFGQSMLKGKRAALDPTQLDPASPKPIYTHPNGELWIGDAVAWLRSLETACADLIF